MAREIGSIDILQTRASVNNGWFIRGLDWNETTDFGYVPDMLNFWFDGGTLPAESQVKLRFEQQAEPLAIQDRSEERRVGKECRSRWSP